MFVRLFFFSPYVLLATRGSSLFVKPWPCMCVDFRQKASCQTLFWHFPTSGTPPSLLRMPKTQPSADLELSHSHVSQCLMETRPDPGSAARLGLGRETCPAGLMPHTALPIMFHLTGCSPHPTWPSWDYTYEMGVLAQCVSQ